jgi:hypothetical protein
MWPSEPRIINDKVKVDACYAESMAYLASHADVRQRVAQYLWGYHEICDLVPQTRSNFASGHYFPIAESYAQLECAYQLALEGFYRQAVTTMRWVLELGLLQVFFAVRDREETDIRSWLLGAEKTPNRPRLLAELRKLPLLEAFEQRFGFVDRVLQTFDELDAYIHTRGRAYSAFGLAGTNFVVFSERAFLLCVDTLASVVGEVVTTLLLKYPVGLQPLPLTAKFGFFGPMGGYLERHQVELIQGLLDPEEARFLKELSDGDPAVQATVQYLEQLPDLSQEEWQHQSEQLDRMLHEHEAKQASPDPNS